MDDWMRDVDDLQTLLMNKNVLLQREIDILTSQQQEDILKIDKAAVDFGRSSAQINDVET